MIKLIAISGLDGSGKSTQVEILTSYLENQGKKVFYFHATQFSIANKCANRGPSSTKSVAKANWLQIQLRKIALAIDLWRFNKLYKNLEKDGYDYILSDRYFYDTLVNIAYLENKHLKIKNWKLIENLKLKIKSCLYIYLQTDPKKIMSRERKPDQGMAYLEKKKDLYDRYTEIFGMKIIDGNRNKEEIFEEIRNLL